MTIDIEPLKKQLGRKIEDEDVVTQAPIKAMIATFDRPDKVPGEGEPIAPGWHLLYLHSHARPAQLGKDGAAFTGGVLPEIPMPRRMYAGSTFTFDGDIRVGDKLRREIEFSATSSCARAAPATCSSPPRRAASSRRAGWRSPKPPTRCSARK